MPPHRTQISPETLETDLYATRAADQPVPKLRVPALNLVRDGLLFDSDGRQHLALFCQTWVNDKIHQLTDPSIDKNIVDRDEYSAIAKIERRCVHIIADLWPVFARRPQAAFSDEHEADSDPHGGAYPSRTAAKAA